MNIARTDDGWAVSEITNQSSGYCPDENSWPAAAIALDDHWCGSSRPVDEHVRVPAMSSVNELNVVKEGDFVCESCGADLPSAWNVAPAS